MRIMTFTAFILVFISAFLHAGWNFLSKKQVPSLAFYSLTSTTATLLSLPGFLLLGLHFSTLPAVFWPLWIGSLFFEVIYVYGLAHAYRRDDISLVYPLARALPVLLTAVVTLAIGIGVSPSGKALAGMVVLSSGCILLPVRSLRDFSRNAFRSGALKYILLAAVGTTGYTILDSVAIRLIRANAGISAFSCSISYLFMIEGGLAVALLAATAWNPAERAEFKKLFLKTATPMVSGLFSSSAYVLVLLAMGYVNNVSYIQAFRQMSLPLGVLAGVALLHERPGKPRLAGIALVIAGLVITAFGS